EADAGQCAQAPEAHLDVVDLQKRFAHTRYVRSCCRYRCQLLRAAINTKRPRGRKMTISTMARPKNKVWIAGKWFHNVSLMGVSTPAPKSGPATVPTPPSNAMTMGNTLFSAASAVAGSM